MNGWEYETLGTHPRPPWSAWPHPPPRPHPPGQPAQAHPPTPALPALPQVMSADSWRMVQDSIT